MFEHIFEKGLLRLIKNKETGKLEAVALMDVVYDPEILVEELVTLNGKMSVIKDDKDIKITYVPDMTTAEVAKALSDTVEDEDITTEGLTEEQLILMRDFFMNSGEIING